MKKAFSELFNNAFLKFESVYALLTLIEIGFKTGTTVNSFKEANLFYFLSFYLILIAIVLNREGVTSERTEC